MKIYKSEAIQRRGYSSQPKTNKKLLIKFKKQNIEPKNNFNKRFEQLVRICQSISNKPLQICKDKKIITKKYTQCIDLSCNDETIESVLKSRQKGVRSSRSFRLDLPQIKQKQLQQEDSFTKDRNLCLTQRIIKKKTSEFRNTQMSTNIKTKSIKSTKSTKSQKYKQNQCKNQHHSKSITPFDAPLQKSINKKIKVNLDVRKLLNNKNIINRQTNSRDKDKYYDNIPSRKICSSIASYHNYLGPF